MDAWIADTPSHFLELEEFTQGSYDNWIDGNVVKIKWGDSDDTYIDIVEEFYQEEPFDFNTLDKIEPRCIDGFRFKEERQAKQSLNDFVLGLEGCDGISSLFDEAKA